MKCEQKFSRESKFDDGIMNEQFVRNVIVTFRRGAAGGSGDELASLHVGGNERFPPEHDPDP